MQKVEASGRPAAGEFAPYAHADIEMVGGDDAIAALLEQRHETRSLFEEFGEGHGATTYAEGKWSVK